MELHLEVKKRSYQTIGSEVAVRLSVLGAGPLYPEEDFCYSFLLEAEQTFRLQ
jgi:hypothetical protein